MADDILKNIIEQKAREVEENKQLYPEKLLQKSVYYPTQPVSLKKYLLREDKSGIIAEFKRQSPSKGTINGFADVAEVTVGYMMANASALSVLTDRAFFAGKNDDLKVARDHNFCPILRKDFIIDAYQIEETKSIGADVVLLIAACLSADKLRDLAKRAKDLGLEVLAEIHSKEELEKVTIPEVDLIGVNNRNLETFEVSMETSLQLSDQIPPDFLKISESGINDPAKLIDLYSAGYRGFLIGEYFMKHSQPEKVASRFIGKYMTLRKEKME